jgi:hypothetical protein
MSGQLVQLRQPQVIGHNGLPAAVPQMKDSIQTASRHLPLLGLLTTRIGTAIVDLMLLCCCCNREVPQRRSSMMQIEFNNL